MTIDIPSFVVGLMFTWALSCVVIGVMVAIDWWQEKKKRERALDQLLAEVGIACIERPTNVRYN